MKKIFLIFFGYLFFVRSIFAFEFVKATENPLNVSFINGYAYQLQANIFKEDIYKGIFVIKRPSETYYSLGYFESNGGINWQMKKEVLNTGIDLSNPSVLKTETGYILFISRYDNNTVYKIYSSNCDFDFNCSANLLPVVTPDTTNYSERNGVFAGHPFTQDNRTYLFYGAWGKDGFKIKLAYSDDLVTWQRCPNEGGFLYGGDGPFPYADKNNLYIFFHKSDSSGIKLAKSTLPLTCDSVFDDEGYLLYNDKFYDQRHLIFPSIVNDNGALKLYYSGLGSNLIWRLDLALIPTPTTGSENPIVILPGTFASWNQNAILHNKEVSYKDWKLQSFVKEYDGLINTLINLGYELNKNLFIFPFDWRQEVEKSADNLNSFLKEKVWTDNPDKKINIIGHSLGGLIGRIYTQKNKDKINQIITVGTPHQGVVQVYKPLESGEIDRDNSFFWLAAKTILILNKSTIESDRVTLASKFPVAKDLFPTFNFLKDADGREIDINNLSIKNSFLLKYNQSFSDIFPIFTAIYGEDGKNTPAGFIVEPQNNLDQLLGNYSDGKPKELYFDLGDYTVLSKSAAQDADAEKLNLDHGALIYKKGGIKKILDLLNIKYEDSQVVEGKGTNISSSLIFMIKSPAKMTVKFNNQIYTEDEGIIFIPDAQSGSYNLKVKGTGIGKYEVIVGQISKNNDLWESIYGETTASQTDDYNILYNSPSPSPTPIILPTPLLPTQSGFAGQATPTVILVPTSTPQPISSTSTSSTITLSSNEIPKSKESTPEVLGISSHQEELIAPPVEATKQLVKKEIKKSTNIWGFVCPSLVISILVEIIWFIRKKLAKK
jgi:pimeloyl-ACP methyl ester carboxylesterase